MGSPSCVRCPQSSIILKENNLSLLVGVPMGWLSWLGVSFAVLHVFLLISILTRLEAINERMAQIEYFLKGDKNSLPFRVERLLDSISQKIK